MKLKLAGKEHKNQTIVSVGDVHIGGDELVLIAGPCAIESEDQLFETARLVKEAGAQVLRGGAFKPRTSPYSFQGLGEEGLKYLYQAGQENNMPVISEIMDARDIDMLDKYVDIFQIGSRNMQNYSLLREVGKGSKPVMLKRGMAASIKEWLSAAEYIVLEGNKNVILCERGIRTFENYTRNTLDLMAVPIIKELSHFPIIVDPSHGTGRVELVASASRAAVAIGAHGLMVEVHPSPCDALSDGIQSLDFHMFEKLSKELLEIHNCVNGL
ncbi:MAG: phospho-2-dehydro-3-deoxyheptonate aldolase [Anaerosolibacter sp.]|jgi:3-deoxy-7-phosphoheptulonate synthase|uniref:3-deoxy-7-phosphoheptulonate synthase n=1 Tax=Anaerosolibacter sp. TaxID=1872527 RepID=UPI00263641A9|nr:3-deoxy-7-phosphoheptulonate synthase [Anaerosolibacter sp.]MDF2546858.1 phospho-2-dehydro-3-deoxyheptonate aldolase [Anaerosolibacter sp.]